MCAIHIPSQHPPPKKKIFIRTVSKTGNTEKCQLWMCRISLGCLVLFYCFCYFPNFLYKHGFLKKLLRCNSQTIQFTLLKVCTSLVFSMFTIIQASSHFNFTTFSYPPKQTLYPLIVTNCSHPPDTINLLSILQTCLFWIFHINGFTQYVVFS